MSKLVFSNLDSRKKILQGIEKVVSSVGSTLGPAGRKVIIEKSFGGPRFTKDGVSVAKEIQLSDPLENIGCSLVKELASNTVDAAGDGTSSACVIFGEMCKSGFEKIDIGMNPLSIARGMQDACNAILAFLNDISSKIKDNPAKIEQVATISTNGDKRIGKLIASAVEKIGSEGIITVDDAQSTETVLEVTKGMEIEKGYISPYFINNPKKGICELEDPYILICDHKITAINPLIGLLEELTKSGKSLLIISDSLEGVALNTLIINVANKFIKVAAIQAPGFGDRKKDNLEDIATITGGRFISQDISSLENLSIDHLGRAEKVTITKDKTTIVGGKGNKENIVSRCEIIDNAIKTASEYEKKNLEKRRANLSNGVAVIKVGGVTEAEQKELKDRVEDAVLAVKASLEEGVVPGGGISLIHAAKKVCSELKSKSSNRDYIIGVDIVSDAVKAPFKQNLQNAGEEYNVILHRIEETGDFNIGYDSANKGITNMIEQGIIDSKKSVKSGLELSTSYAVSLLTSKFTIVNEPESKEDKQSNNMMPNMGGMY
ncbi:MAG: chaperonin GroEL [Alphaproteobacteria bacterium]|nr:MAG: chaperonin GroEL [Alphaproteobacteria bacterium]